MQEQFDVNVDNELNIIENESHYTWIINSTGSDTFRTRFSPDLEQYLANRGFTKIFSGSPMYATNIGYEEHEIKEICIFIMDMRKKYGQNVEQIRASYMPGSYLKNLRYDFDKK
ncbi:hypothetical protein [Brachyspira innocens]|uniref:hypothetical protein n=1 Tax=Brachyspira innocens TaxID=13264 RepID=UPI0026F18912|nr:hypothetical protein [Brachyspira innocens]